MSEKDTTNNFSENDNKDAVEVKPQDDKNQEAKAENSKNSKEEKNKKENKDNKKDSNKGSFFNDHKAEFKKIVWPSRQDLVKQTVTVIIVSLLVGAIIFGMDSIYNIAYTQFINLLA